ncbi:MAG: hypothetical protein RIR26_275 [Pseudomonadota bacterium]
MKAISSALLTLLAATACIQNPNPESDVNAVRSQKNQDLVLVGLSLSPAKNNNESGEIFSSCGYEINLKDLDSTVVSSLNKFAYDSRTADFQRHLKFYTGGATFIAGTVLGAIIAGGGAAATWLFPPAAAGVPIGFMVATGSMAVGGGLGVSAQHELDRMNSAISTFARLSSGHYVTDIWYDNYKETIQKSSNTTKLCPPLKQGDLKKLTNFNPSEPAQKL